MRRRGQIPDFADVMRMQEERARQERCRRDTGLAGKTPYPGVTWIGSPGDTIRDNAIVTRKWLTDVPIVDRSGRPSDKAWMLGDDFASIPEALAAFRNGTPPKAVMDAYLEVMRSGEFDALPRVRGLRRKVVPDDLSGDVVNLHRVWTMDRPWDRMQRTGGVPRLTIGLGIGGHMEETGLHFTKQITLAVAAADRLIAAGYDIRIVGFWSGWWTSENHDKYALQFMVKDFGAPLDPGLALASGTNSAFRAVVIPKLADIYQFNHMRGGSPWVLEPAVLKAECGIDLSIAAYGGRNTVDYVSDQLRKIDEANHAFC